VQRVIRAPSHCGFYAETRERAFDDLVAWIERGVRPEGEDVLAPDLSRRAADASSRPRRAVSDRTH
jgi:hypothetical protein